MFFFKLPSKRTTDSDNPFADHERTKDSDNPFAAPESESSAPPAALVELSEVSRIRKEHLQTESSLQQTGIFLFLYVSYSLVLATPAVFVKIYVADSGSGSLAKLLFLLPDFIALILGIGLYKLKNWARISSVVAILLIAALGIIDSIRVGSYNFLLCIGLVFIFFLVNKKAAYTCSPEYARIIKATPSIKYTSPTRLKILVAILLSIILLPVIAFLFIIIMFVYAFSG